MSVLTKFQSNIYSIGNKTVRYLRHQIGSLDDFIMFSSYSVIIAQSSSCVLPGGYIEVTAGIGEFSRAVKAVVTVNGRNIPVDETAVATTKFRAAARPGKYTVPVKMDFIDREGKPMTITRDIKYTVFNKDSTAQ